MYIDFSKFNYNLIPETEREKYIRRDKEAYAKILKKWLEDNIDKIINRKWEIEDIVWIKQTNDFVRLLKEAEMLYELGFFTSCIALIGVCAEDFTKYIALQFNRHNLVDESQFKRLKSLLDANLINSSIFDNLDNIRSTRNNCLHYDIDFKRKNDEELKQEALNVLNKFKNTMELLLGFDGDISWEEFEQVIIEISKEDKYIKGFEDKSFKLRNAMSRLFSLDITIKPGVRKIETSSIYKVLEIDLDYNENSEVTILDLNNGIPLIVDLDDRAKEKLMNLVIVEGDLIEASVYSEVSTMGQTKTWMFTEFKKTLR